MDLYTSDLPVTAIFDEVRAQLQTGNTLIVTAPPGAGKSTLLPLLLLNEPWLLGKKIVVLEPRRLAARSIAHRMSTLLGEELGKRVGYKIRFENRTTKTTQIEVVTEGILTRMLQADNALENVGAVIFDEFHERSIHADLALALCREAQQVLRSDLRILIMSATLNLEQLSALLKCAVVKSEGRQYPVQIEYGEDADERLLPELIARKISSVASIDEGDVLVFLPGEGEIRRCEELLKSVALDCLVLPLYGQLSQSEQDRAIRPDPRSRRKIVLATSIAETSLTIEGISIVVDSGFARVSRFDTRSGLTRLETVRISKDSADQRAGRAGRLTAGKAYRMWTMATHQRLNEHRTPEILDADLADLVLDLAQWGHTDPYKLAWLTPPPEAAIAQASDLLGQIGALENKRITPHGLELHKLACHPRIANMLLLAPSQKEQQLGCDLAAILEEKDPLSKEIGVDINLRIEALRRARSNNSMGRFGRLQKVAQDYCRMLGIKEDNGPFDAFDTGLLLAHAYPERIASARPGNNAQFQLSNGKIAAMSHTDDLAHQPWLAVAHIDQRDGLGKIFLASPLNPKDLKDLIREREYIIWDSRKGGIIAARELRIGNLVLQSKPLTKVSDELAIPILERALISEGKQLLDFNDDFQQLQNRINSLRQWRPHEDWPPVTSQQLLTSINWLNPFLTGVRKPDDFKRINLSEALKSSLTWEQQNALDKLAPAKIQVPSGSKIVLEYFENGATPVLAVRLQEVFGLADTPTINDGKVRVVMHLLSPGFKPVQVTSDLKSFWNNLYFEVKKELQRRYPKHSWPEDPWTARAVAKGRSRS